MQVAKRGALLGNYRGQFEQSRVELGLCCDCRIAKAERSLLLTHTATTVNASLYTPMKY